MFIHYTNSTNICWRTFFPDLKMGSNCGFVTVSWKPLWIYIHPDLMITRKSVNIFQWYSAVLVLMNNKKKRNTKTHQEAWNWEKYFQWSYSLTAFSKTKTWGHIISPYFKKKSRWNMKEQYSHFLIFIWIWSLFFI